MLKVQETRTVDCTITIRDDNNEDRVVKRSQIIFDNEGVSTVAFETIEDPVLYRKHRRTFRRDEDAILAYRRQIEDEIEQRSRPASPKNQSEGAGS